MKNYLDKNIVLELILIKIRNLKKLLKNFKKLFIPSYAHKIKEIINKILKDLKIHPIKSESTFKSDKIWKKHKQSSNKQLRK
jgi:hypothetical protein